MKMERRGFLGSVAAFLLMPFGLKLPGRLEKRREPDASFFVGFDATPFIEIRQWFGENESDFLMEVSIDGAKMRQLPAYAKLGCGEIYRGGSGKWHAVIKFSRVERGAVDVEWYGISDDKKTIDREVEGKPVVWLDEKAFGYFNAANLRPGMFYRSKLNV